MSKSLEWHWLIFEGSLPNSPIEPFKKIADLETVADVQGFMKTEGREKFYRETGKTIRFPPGPMSKNRRPLYVVKVKRA